MKNIQFYFEKLLSFGQIFTAVVHILILNNYNNNLLNSVALNVWRHICVLASVVIRVNNLSVFFLCFWFTSNTSQTLWTDVELNLLKHTSTDQRTVQRDTVSSCWVSAPCSTKSGFAKYPTEVDGWCLWGGKSVSNRDATLPTPPGCVG